MSTNTERSPWETPASRAEPMTDLDKQGERGGAEDFLTVRCEQAIKRIKAKNDFKIHLVVYLAVNTMLVVIWAFTNAGQPFPQGFFWPIFPIVGWGIGVVINGYVAYRGNVYTEEQIQREMQKLP
jgi:2TM domain